jgi:hypothetical protein
VEGGGRAVSGVLGFLGLWASCSSLVFAMAPGLAGLFGAAVTGMGHVPLPGFAQFFSRYAVPILAVSAILLGLAVARAGALAQGLTGLGLVFLVINLAGMTPALFVPGMALVVAGGVAGWLNARPHPPAPSA